MICVSVGNIDAGECMERLSGLELAEVRLDTMDVDPVSVRAMFSLPLRLVATCRPGRYSDVQRLDLLSTAIKAGAAYVDVETDAATGFREEIRGLASRHSVQLIVSYHNYRETPGARRLQKMIRDAFSSGAHLVKIACMVNRPVENLRLLDLLGMKAHAGRLIVVGMGEAGRITRVASVFLGSPFTYACHDDDGPYAPGQMSVRRLRKAMELIENG
jgi:3-dehydroquinate dehydratase type I